MKTVIDVKRDDCRVCWSDEGAKKYLEDIRLYHPMAREEEYAVASRYANAVKELKTLPEKLRNGAISTEDYNALKAENEKIRDEASDAIVKSNLRFVYAVAIRIGKQSDIQDLITEGVIGMLTALETFDVSLGNRFLSHAVWYIRRNMIVYTAETSHSVRFSQESLIVPKVRRFVGKYYTENGRDPSAEEIKKYLDTNHGLGVKSDNMLMGVKMSSINEMLGDGDGDNSVETYSDFATSTATHNDYMDTIDAEEKHLMLMEAMDRLTEREREIILLSSGLKDGREWTNYDIGQELGITAERVRQIAIKAKKKLSMDKKLAMAYCTQ